MWTIELRSVFNSTGVDIYAVYSAILIGAGASNIAIRMCKYLYIGLYNFRFLNIETKSLLNPELQAEVWLIISPFKSVNIVIPIVNANDDEILPIN